jgi:hypothetical protein
VSEITFCLMCILFNEYVTKHSLHIYSIAKRGITDEKAALQSALDTFETEGLKNGSLPFSSGNPHTPDMGDLAVFGVLYAVRDMNAHADAVEKRGGVIKDWYERMEKIVVR